jgi:hypothetical protein
MRPNLVCTSGSSFKRMPSGALKVLALFAPEELEALEALEALEPFELALVPVFELP